jgi:hypothetical protein
MLLKNASRKSTDLPPNSSAGVAIGVQAATPVRSSVRSVGGVGDCSALLVKQELTLRHRVLYFWLFRKHTPNMDTNTVMKISKLNF